MDRNQYLKIRSDRMNASIDLHGGGIQGLEADNVSLIKPSNDGHKTHGGMAILAPYANRVRNGTYSFMGSTHKLPLNKEGNAIHGFAKDSMFSLIKEDGSSCRIRSVLTGKGYPWKIRLDISYLIGDTDFKCTAKAHNLSDTPAPFQMGFHPYFTYSSYWSLISNQPGAYLEYKEKYFPDGSAKVIDPFLLESSDGKNLDNSFLHSGKVIFTTRGRKLIIDRENLNYLVLYNGVYSEGKSIAIEPMTAPPDAFNNELGLLTLNPGSTIRVSFKIKVIMTEDV
ncbi:MAG: aldose 1-epimerase [Candidatus Thermoplasmatota archaeon]|nr:aldose 1-epimerase [Candidatus Thermoplasmatota archaeon]